MVKIDNINIIEKIVVNVLIALYQPFGFSILFSVFFMFFYLYAYQPINVGKGWKSAVIVWLREFKLSLFFRKLFLLTFVTVMILFRTLLNRSLWENPLSNVMGGWTIWKTVNGKTELTTECIENVIMMVPFTVLLMWTMAEKLVKKLCFKSIIWKSTKIAFSFSMIIELLQLFMRLGTFQLSDLCYNTLGGMLGGIIYWVYWRLYKNRSS